MQQTRSTGGRQVGGDGVRVLDVLADGEPDPHAQRAEDHRVPAAVARPSKTCVRQEALAVDA